MLGSWGWELKPKACGEECSKEELEFDGVYQACYEFWQQELDYEAEEEAP